MPAKSKCALLDQHRSNEAICATYVANIQLNPFHSLGWSHPDTIYLTPAQARLCQQVLWYVRGQLDANSGIAAYLLRVSFVDVYCQICDQAASAPDEASGKGLDPRPAES